MKSFSMRALRKFFDATMLLEESDFDISIDFYWWSKYVSAKISIESRSPWTVRQGDVVRAWSDVSQHGTRILIDHGDSVLVINRHTLSDALLAAVDFMRVHNRIVRDLTSIGEDVRVAWVGVRDGCKIRVEYRFASFMMRGRVYVDFASHTFTSPKISVRPYSELDRDVSFERWLNRPF